MLGLYAVLVQAPSPRKNHGVMSDVSLSSNTKH